MGCNDKEENGALDGLTILRYAHAYESGGGVEQHLADLNRELSKRNRMVTIQVQLTLDPAKVTETEEKVGNSLVLKVPLLVQKQHSIAQINSATLVKKIQESALNCFLRTPRLNNAFMGNLSRWRKVPKRTGEPKGAGPKAAEIIRRFKVDLVVLHTIGGRDASEIIDVTRSAGIPIAVVHHFSNDRLGGVSARQQLSQVDLIGGASWVGVPNYLRRGFWNLSDAVDTEFYSHDNARPLPRTFSCPVIFAPGRVTPEKGQADVIEVAAVLRKRGLHVKVIFAGRLDLPDFEARLRRMAAVKQLNDSIEFLGPLPLEEYRDWYGIARVMVMPTYHDEGMPRTLIESQAMGVPPVVYNVGGTREGVKSGETGFLFKLGDVAGICEAVESLIRNDDLYRRMALAGRRFVRENFSLEAFAQRHEEFYTLALMNGRRRIRLQGRKVLKASA